MKPRNVILAPLRGVTVRCFRETFADIIRETGFTEAVTPFITAAPGYDPLRDRELRDCGDATTHQVRLTPQFIGKDPEALRCCLIRIKSAGFDTADLNCGCPFPMVRNKGRGSGLLRTPDVLRAMLEVGCSVMGPGRFSVKARLGIDCTDELLRLMPLLNEFPIRLLTVHARTARQMYEGACDRSAFDAVCSVATMPVVYNGDVDISRLGNRDSDVMIGRPFVRAIGERDDVGVWLGRYIVASRAELCGDRPVLGRIKELLAYWSELPSWRRRWQVAKLSRSLDELCLVLSDLPGFDGNASSK